MMALKEWFDNLTRKEQNLLFLCGGVVLLFLLINVIWRPITESLDQFRLNNQVAEEQLLTVRRLAAEYNTLKGAGANVSNASINLPQLINTSVARNKLQLKRLQPSSSGDVQVRFENASFNSIVAWLHELEIDNGVLIKDLSITPGSNSGLVNVSVRLHKGG